MCERAGGLCLSIAKLDWHLPAVGRSLIHRSDPLTWLHTTLTATLGALLSRLVCPKCENASLRDCRSFCTRVRGLTLVCKKVHIWLFFRGAVARRGGALDAAGLLVWRRNFTT